MPALRQPWDQEGQDLALESSSDDEPRRVAGRRPVVVAAVLKELLKVLGYCTQKVVVAVADQAGVAAWEVVGGDLKPMAGSRVEELGAEEVAAAAPSSLVQVGLQEAEAVPVMKSRSHHS